MSACSVDGCRKPHKARGLCDMHYWRVKRAGKRLPSRVRRPVPLCKAEGCGSRVHARELCRMHYKRWQREHPDLVGDRPPATGDRPLPPRELAYLRRLVGIPENGPTRDQINRWLEQESEKGVMQ